MTQISGNLFIGQAEKQGTHGKVYALDAVSGEQIEPAFGGATKEDLDQACALAANAFAVFRNVTPEKRAAFLERIAQNIADLGDVLIERCMQETGLPKARVQGERGRTMGQLKLFAGVLRSGEYLGARIDPAQPEREPLPRVDLRLQHIGLGPVAVFGASNFPLAFSVAGGDTASALAAGCPVIVKAHSAHPGTSELVARAVQQAVKDFGLPEGVFSLLFDSDRSIGQGLVADPRIKAVGFTGSRTGGMALMNIANARKEPIPVYAEMSSINPVILFPNALKTRAEEIAAGFVPALNMGAGQFCTNPGLIFAVKNADLSRFAETTASMISDTQPANMLTPGIHKAYVNRLRELEAHPKVTMVAQGPESGKFTSRVSLFAVSAEDFMAHPELHEEAFGAASLLVKCDSLQQLQEAVSHLEGQLTAAVHFTQEDYPDVSGLLPLLETRAGRLIANGFGTGVEVTHAMVHGGPFPATSDSRTTSVGSLAIHRFLRPVSYQDFPEALLPPALQQSNPLNIPVSFG